MVSYEPAERQRGSRESGSEPVESESECENPSSRNLFRNGIRNQRFYTFRNVQKHSNCNSTHNRNENIHCIPKHILSEIISENGVRLQSRQTHLSSFIPSKTCED